VHDIPNTKAQPQYPKGMELGLYDLSSDPHETSNLADKQPGVVRDLTKQKDDFYATLMPSLATPPIIEQWRRELQQRKEKLPNCDALRRDGAPGYWNGR
jgi:hypothetical protein